MRRLDIINQAVAKAGLADIDNIPTNLNTLAIAFLNRVYENVWNVYPFRDEKVVTSTISASSQDLVFPQEVDTLRALRSATNPITPIGELTMSRFAPGMFDDTGANVYYFYNMPDSPVLTQPSAATAITIVSDDTNDTTQTVRIFGLVGGLETFEDISLNGLTPVAGSLLFTELKSISKDLTTGRISIKESTTTLGTIPGWDYKGAYRKVRLNPSPSAAETLYFEATRRFLRLTSDSDTLLLGKAGAAIFSLLMAELHEYNKDYGAGTTERQRGGSLLTLAIDVEEDKDSEDNRSFPDEGMHGTRTSEYAESQHKTF